MYPAPFSWNSPVPALFLTTAKGVVAAKQNTLEAVFAVPAKDRTFANTIAALQSADDAAADIQQQLDLFINVHPDSAVRDAAREAVDFIEKENIALEYNPQLFRAVQEWEERGEQLAADERKLADDTVRDLRRMGFALPSTDFEELKRNTIALKKLETEFEKAINDWKDAVILPASRCAGLPARFLEGLTRTGDNYRISLEYPDYFPFMQLSEDAEARNELATKELQKGGPQNLDRLADMLRLRQRNAQLLDYATHADYVTEIRMAKSRDTVEQFLKGIITGLVPVARREMTELIDYKKRVLGTPHRQPLAFHETSFWGHRLLKERYDLDSEMLKEYFPLDRVVSGMMDVYQEVLGVRFSEVQEPLWHPDVRLYAVHQGERLMGHFAMDLYPRPDKYGHAAAFPVRIARGTGSAQVPTFVALVCNFPKATPSHASLLSHDEVETLFHEFGHAIHWLLSPARWSRQNGCGVAMDFVEALSQLFEEWAWNPAVLSRISAHYRTGHPLPSELIEKMLAARRHLLANYYLQQAVKALYDIRIHGRPTDTPVDAAGLASLYREMKLDIETLEIPESSLFPAGWGHMADYDAGYYSYLWSKVYALDMYTQFDANPLDAAVGARFRAEVLAPGSSRDELKLVRDFLSREPSDAPFLAALGIGKEVDEKP